MQFVAQGGTAFDFAARVAKVTTNWDIPYQNREDTAVRQVRRLGSGGTATNTVEKYLAYAVAENIAGQVGVSPTAVNTVRPAFNAFHWVGSDWCRYYA